MDATAGTVQGKRGRKMTVTCNKCGIVKGFIEEKGNQTGLYCNKCGKWIKWLTKDEKRLFCSQLQIKNDQRRPDQEHDGRGVGNGAIMCPAEFIKK